MLSSIYLCKYLCIGIGYLYIQYIWTGCWSCLREKFQMCLNIALKETARCTGSQWSRDDQEILEAIYQLNSETYFDAIIKETWGWTCTPWLSELEDTLRFQDEVSWEMRFGDQDGVNCEMHYEAAVEWVKSCTWRAWTCEHGGQDWASTVIHWNAILIWAQRVWLRVFGNTPRGCNQGNSEITCRPWTSEFGDALRA